MRQLSLADAAFVHMERPRTPNHVLPVYLYDPSRAPGGVVTLDDVLSHLAHRVHEARTLREKLVRVPFELDWPYWVEDDNFDLEFHVRHLALPPPGDWNQFMTQTARLHARPLDMTRPPWELYLIDGLGPMEPLPNGGFAVVMKVHHAAIDGVAGAELVNVLHSSGPESADDPAPPVRGEPVPSNVDLLGRTAVNLAATPPRLVRAVSRTAPVRRLRRRLRGAPGGAAGTAGQAPPTRFNGRVSAHRVVDGRFVPLESVKALRKPVPGATVNDVALAIVGGALRLYLGAKGELPEQSLTAMVPISVRVGDASEGGNQISAMVVPMATDIADRIEQLAAISVATQAQKARREGMDAGSLTALSEALPGALLGNGLRMATRMMSRGPRIANTTVTNVPGPATHLHLCGAEAVRGMGGGPLVDGLGLINLVGSYGREFSLSFTACREMLPDPTVYADCLQQSYEDLRSAASSTAGVT